LRTSRARRSSSNIVSTRALMPPCLVPSAAARPAMTTAYGVAPAEATQRAVKEETFSSWSALRMIAARSSSAPCAVRGTQRFCSVSSIVSSSSEDSAAMLASRLRMRQPVCATARGRRSKASASRAATSGSTDCARETNGSPSALRVPATTCSCVAAKELASKSPVQISAAISSIERARASSAASWPR
jgi:hypothetical protein